mmetsp:Transcript_18136/g.45687  ORF Transcript_18136/g.45687 Transcript_18136/m.45687 type:complete len:175 (+) Transcript_18136:1999-2523(+)
MAGVLLVQAVRDGGGGGLVDDAQHVEARDLAGVLGGLALGVVEVGGHSDDRLLHLVVQELGGVSRQLAQHLRADLLGRELLVGVGGPDLDVALPVLHELVRDLLGLLLHLLHLAADEALHGEEGVLGVDHGLALGDLANQAVSSLGECHHGGGGAATLGVGDDSGLATLHGSHR